MGINGVIKLLTTIIAPIIMYFILPDIGCVSKGAYTLYGCLLGSFMFLSGYFTETGS